MRYLRCILLCFEAISGLKVYLVKSELVLVGIVASIEELAAFLSCSVSPLPLKYLGLLLGAIFNSRAFGIL